MVWWRWRPPLVLILLQIFIIFLNLPPNLPPNDRIRGSLNRKNLLIFEKIYIISNKNSLN